MQVVLLDNNENDYSQNQQSSDVTYAPLSYKDGKLYQTHPWFRCKDFFNEVVCSRRAGAPYTQYGFTYCNGKYPTREHTEFLMQTTHHDRLSKGIKKYLHPLEKEAGLELTKCTSVEDNIVHIEGDAGWYAEPYMVSIYAFVLRIIAYKEHRPATWKGLLAKTTTGTDAALLRKFHNFGKLSHIEALVLNFKRTERTDAEFKASIEGVNMGTLHNDMGFLGLTKVLTGNGHTWDVNTMDKVHPNLRQVFGL